VATPLLNSEYKGLIDLFLRKIGATSLVSVLLKDLKHSDFLFCFGHFFIEQVLCYTYTWYTIIPALEKERQED
jgi:hypothetical protein